MIGMNIGKAIEFYKAKSYEEGGIRDRYTRLAATIKLSLRKEDLYFTREEAEKALEQTNGACRS